MRRKFLATTAILLASMSVALAQGHGGAGNAGAGGGGAGAPAQSQGAPQSGSHETGATHERGGAQAPSGAQERGRSQEGAPKSAPAQERPRQERAPNAAQERGTTGAKERGNVQEHRTGTQTNSSTNSSTNVTEQKTTIRNSVSSGPRVSNPSFSVAVGTTVPRDVRVVAVPAEVVRVHREWRGFSYFIVGDQMIIVDRSHRIVAVYDL